MEPTEALDEPKTPPSSHSLSSLDSSATIASTWACVNREAWRQRLDRRLGFSVGLYAL